MVLLMDLNVACREGSACRITAARLNLKSIRTDTGIAQVVNVYSISCADTINFSIAENNDVRFLHQQSGYVNAINSNFRYAVVVNDGAVTAETSCTVFCLKTERNLPATIPKL